MLTRFQIIDWRCYAEQPENGSLPGDVYVIATDQDI